MHKRYPSQISWPNGKHEYGKKSDQDQGISQNKCVIQQGVLEFGSTPNYYHTCQRRQAGEKRAHSIDEKPWIERREDLTDRGITHLSRNLGLKWQHQPIK
ncbi:MAG: hypothetical protein NT154_05395 [Verrucomicrobia bacterium]|nr:hypothetical protein [Verrucomicrobiota bacterium]